MSKYNKLPGDFKETAENAVITPPPKMPISKLCCLPVFMAENKNYRKQLNQIMSLEELMPKTQRLEIYQMMYMDKLLEQVREYRPQVEEQEKDPIEIISKIDKTGKASKMAATMSSMMKYKSTGDMSSLMSAFMPENPMMSMLLPMLQGGMSGGSKGASNGGMGDMMQSILPMMMGQNSDMMSSLFKGML